VKEGFKAEWTRTWFLWSHLALDNFRDGSYDLLLLEIKMPEWMDCNCTKRWKR